jgi:hypothetical protein
MSRNSILLMYHRQTSEILIIILLCIVFNCEDGSNMLFRNVRDVLLDDTASLLRS